MIRRFARRVWCRARRHTRTLVACPEHHWRAEEVEHPDGRVRVAVLPCDVFIIGCVRCDVIDDSIEFWRLDLADVVHPDGSMNPLDEE